MLQQESEVQLYLVQGGSHCLTDTESRYAVIELELGHMKMQFVSYGVVIFEVIIDHNPLITIHNYHRLYEIKNHDYNIFK